MSEYQYVEHEFAPVYNEESQVLVLGSLPPLCTILYRLGMTGTLSRPNCVIFTSDLLPLHTYT